MVARVAVLAKTAVEIAAPLTLAGSILVGKGIKAVAAKAFAPFATTAAWIAAPVIYTWKPVHWLVNSLAAPLVENAAEAAGLSMPVPAQMLGAYLGYEAARRSFWTNPLDLKRAAAFSAVALYASQDPTAQRIARSAMTSTVLGTLGFCAALDYLDAAAKEGRWVPSVLVDMANDAANKVKNIAALMQSKPPVNKPATTTKSNGGAAKILLPNAAA
jgi:hypothetical protein